MKNIGSILLDIVVGVWFTIAIFVTICLLSYNEFKVTTFGKYSLIIIDSDEMEPKYLEGDLLVVKKNSNNKIEVGDMVFYYNSMMNSSVMIFMDEVQAKEDITKTETTFTLDNVPVSSAFVIGKTETTKAYHKLGAILGILSSKWGFMFLVILPTLFAIMYEIMMLRELSRKKKLVYE